MSDLKVEQPAYTPGPWELSPLDSLGPVDVYTRNHKRIACIVATGINAGAETNANARLIAAAPELLEAVRAGGRYSDALRRHQDNGVRGEVIPGTDELDRLFMEWHDKGHAAIARAEGRS